MSNILVLIRDKNGSILLEGYTGSISYNIESVDITAYGDAIRKLATGRKSASIEMDLTQITQVEDDYKAENPFSDILKAMPTDASAKPLVPAIIDALAIPRTLEVEGD